MKMNDKITSVTLVKTWLEHFTGRGLTKQVALDVLNQKLGTSYAHSHLSRWERGEREPNAAARLEMMKVVLRSEFPKKRADELLDKLS